MARSLDDALLSDVDREALERAIELAKAESPAHRQQIENMLRTEGWDEVAHFAAYCCQDHRLKLKPWEMPPVWVRGDPDAILAAPESDHDHRGQRQAALLLKRLLAAGLSKYEPDPEAALAKAEAKGKAKARRGRPPAARPADGRGQLRTRICFTEPTKKKPPRRTGARPSHGGDSNYALGSPSHATVEAIR